MKSQEVIFVGTRSGLRLVLDAEENIENLKRVLERRLQEAVGFYSGARVTVETRGAVVAPEWIEEVRSVLAHHGLSMDERGWDGASAGSVDGGASAGREPEAPPDGAGQDQSLPGADTVLIRRSLRSGQSVSFDGNIVVMGDVNPGSEVCAAGDIVVFGALRGVAYAGANGSADARVIALRLTPTQLRIADKITRSPDDEVQAPSGPEMAYLRDGAIVIEPWTTHLGAVFGV